MRNLILSLAAVSALAACSPDSATITGMRQIPQPEKPIIPQYDPIAPDQLQWITLDGGKGDLDFNPRVDILFVVDNSDSMKSAQANLVRNIGKFASGIQKNKLIDYNIGVTSVWDSSPAYVSNPNRAYANGELRKIGSSNARFVSKANSTSSILASALNIGVAPLSQGGPEFEEVFSPISEALKLSASGAANQDFFRQDAQLVVVILTDADDGTTSMTSEELADDLFKFKNGQREKVAVYAALVKASDSDDKKDWGLRVHHKYHPECFDGTGPRAKNNGTCKAGFGPDRILDFVVKANAGHGTPAEIRSNNVMSITQSDFGSDLAKIGDDIAAKTLSKTIELPELPRPDANGNPMIKVSYGKQAIPHDPSGKKGWKYDSQENVIKIAGDNGYQYQASATFTVQMVPVTVRAQ